MKKIIQVIPAMANLYGIWKEKSENGDRYGVDRAYYLGLDDDGEVYPLLIDGSGYVETCDCDDYMVFDQDGYQWWKLHDADLPVYEYFNRFKEEQRRKDINFLNDLYCGQMEKENEK